MSFVPECDELEGTIVGFSDSGATARAYAVVEVVRKLSLVVPVNELTLVYGPDENAVDPGS